MRRLLAILAAGLVLAACDPHTPAYVQPPPARFTADRTVVVEFVGDTRARCLALGATLENPRDGLVGCHHAGTLVLPNPCRWPNDSDLRQVGCHELGHANGWPGNHPQ